MTATCGWIQRFKTPLFLWWAAAFTIQIVVDLSRKFPGPRSSIFLLAAFLPALSWTVVIAAFVRAVFQLDELQQRIHLQAIALACVPTATAILIFSALQNSGIYQATAGDIGGCFLLILIPSYGFVAWKYR